MSKRECTICSFLRMEAYARTLPFAEALTAAAAAAIATIEVYGLQRVTKNLCDAHRSAIAEGKQSALKVLPKTS